MTTTARPPSPSAPTSIDFLDPTLMATRQFTRSTGGQGQVLGLYQYLSFRHEAFLIIFFSLISFWIPFIDTGSYSLRRTMDPGGVNFLSSFSKTCQGDLYYQQHNTHTRAKGRKSYQFRGVSYFLDPRYPVFGGSRPRLASGRADVQLEDMRGGRFYFISIAVLLFLAFCCCFLFLVWIWAAQKFMLMSRAAWSGYLDGRIESCCTSR